MSESVVESSTLGLSEAKPSHWPARLALSLFCFTCGSIAFLLTKPVYRSDGLIQLFPDHQQGDQTVPVRSTAQALIYLDSCASDVRSERIAGRAMKTNGWVALRRPTASAAMFRLQIDAQPLSAGRIRISFSDFDPKAAETGASAVITSYRDFSHLCLMEQCNQELAAVESQQRALRTYLARLDARLIEAVEQFGAEDLSPIHIFTILPEVWDLQKKRKAASEDMSDVQKRTLVLRTADLHDPFRIIDLGNLPTAPVVDHRLRNTIGALLSSLIILLGFRKVIRLSRNRYRVMAARTAFPVIFASAPKRVIAIGDLKAAVTRIGPGDC